MILFLLSKNNTNSSPGSTCQGLNNCTFEVILTSSVQYNKTFEVIGSIIRGDPGVTSRDNAIFLGEILLRELKSPWELILDEPVPELIGQKNIFLPNQRGRLTRELCCLLARSSSLAWPSCLAHGTGRLSWRVSEKNIQRSRRNRKP